MGLLRYDLPRSTGGQGLRLDYITRSRDDGDWQSQPHAHDCAEIFCVLRGSGEFRVDSERLEVRAGDLVLVNPHIPHTERSGANGPMEYLVAGVECVRFQPPGGGEERYFRLRDEFSGGYRFYLEAILRECEGRQEGWSEVCASLTQVIFLLLRRQLFFRSTNPSRSKTGSECARVRQYIDEHFAEPLNLDELARLTHMSKHYLVHSFTRETGMSPIRYLLSRRIEESKRLLESSDSSVGQIGLSVGFSSLSYFSQRFKEATDQTPSAYRSALHAGEIQAEKEST